MLVQTIKSRGADKARARLQRGANIGPPLRRGLANAAERVKREVYRRTPVGIHHESRPGPRLRETLFARVEGSGIFLRAVVGFTAPHARFVEEGTAPHPIFPGRPGGVLRWFDVGGRPVFARSVMHPGSAGVFMLRDGLRASAAGVERDIGAQLWAPLRRAA